VVEFPPTTPSTLHVTDVFVDPWTVAVNCCVALVVRVAEVGLMLTLTAVVPLATVIVSDVEK
jgi:hypothetical protein